jgi:hypothetical protein
VGIEMLEASLQRKVVIIAATGSKKPVGNIIGTREEI